MGRLIRFVGTAAVGAFAMTAWIIAPAGASTSADHPSSGETAVVRQAALPAVNMEAVIKAAQIDPRRPDDTQTSAQGRASCWSSELWKHTGYLNTVAWTATQANRPVNFQLIVD